MVQFLLLIFFSWISSIFVGFFKSSRFLCHSVQWLGRDEPVLRLQLCAHFPCWQAGASRCFITDLRLTTYTAILFLILFYIFLPPSPLRTSFTSQSPSTAYPCSQHINLPSLLLYHSAVLSTCHCSLSSSSVFCIDFFFQLLFLLLLLSFRTIYILILHLQFLPPLHTPHFPLHHIYIFF